MKFNYRACGKTLVAVSMVQFVLLTWLDSPAGAAIQGALLIIGVFFQIDPGEFRKTVL